MKDNIRQRKICKQCDVVIRGSRDGAVVRTLTSHQCGLGSIPKLGVICGLSLLLVLVLALRESDFIISFVHFLRGLSYGTLLQFIVMNSTQGNTNVAFKRNVMLCFQPGA